MDCGNDYIKQCEKAEDIQNHKFEEGDYRVWRDKKDNRCGVELYDRDEPILSTLFDYWWLPRQDQLQEMLLTGDFKDGDVGYSIHRLYQFVLRGGYHACSMEQLWLVFAMKYLYSKIWDGNEWVSST